MCSNPRGPLHVQNKKLFWLTEMQQLQQLSEQERVPQSKGLKSSQTFLWSSSDINSHQWILEVKQVTYRNKAAENDYPYIQNVQTCAKVLSWYPSLYFASQEPDFLGFLKWCWVTVLRLSEGPSKSFFGHQQLFPVKFVCLATSHQPANHSSIKEHLTHKIHVVSTHKT